MTNARLIAAGINATRRKGGGAMTEFLNMAESLKDLGASALLIGACLYFAFKFFPDQSRQQGEITEIMRNSVKALSNNTEALRLVSERDAETKESLDRIEKRVDEINLGVHDLQHEQQRKD